MSKKEEQDHEQRECQKAWKKAHNFREIGKCCHLCRYHKFDDPKVLPFAICALSKEELKKPIVIIDNNFVCDEFDDTEEK